jgi:hypothetical protein
LAEICFSARVSPFTGIAADASLIARLDPSKPSATAVILKLVTTTPPIRVRDIATQPTFTHPRWLEAEGVVGQY